MILWSALLNGRADARREDRLPLQLTRDRRLARGGGRRGSYATESFVFGAVCSKSEFVASGAILLHKHEQVKK